MTVALAVQEARWPVALQPRSSAVVAWAARAVDPAAVAGLVVVGGRPEQLPWPWALAVVAAAVVASTVGAVVFSRPMRTTTTWRCSTWRRIVDQGCVGPRWAPRP